MDECDQKEKCEKNDRNSWRVWHRMPLKKHQHNKINDRDANIRAFGSHQPEGCTECHLKYTSKDKKDPSIRERLPKPFEPRAFVGGGA